MLRQPPQQRSHRYVDGAGEGASQLGRILQLGPPRAEVLPRLLVLRRLRLRAGLSLASSDGRGKQVSQLPAAWTRQPPCVLHWSSGGRGGKPLAQPCTADGSRY